MPQKLDDRPRHPRRRWIRQLALWVIAGVVGYAAVVMLHFARAEQLLKSRDVETAAIWLERLDRLWPRSAEVKFRLARAFRRQGRLELSQSYLDSARELGSDPDRVRREEIMAAAQSGQLSRVEPLMRRMLVEPGDDAPEICEALINGFLLNCRFGDAYELLDLWQSDFPDDSQPLFVRGQVAEQLGSSKDAIEFYRQALTRAPGRDDVTLRLFVSLVAQHEYSQAEPLYRELASRHAADAELIVARATCLLETGRPAAAESMLETLVQQHPEHREAKLLLAREYFRGKKAEQSLALLRPHLAQSPKDYDFRYLLAQVLASQGHAEAAEHLEFVQQADAALAKVKLALDHAREKPKDADSHFEIGQNLLEFGFQTEGAGWLRSTLEIAPQHRGAHELLAKHYAAAGLPLAAERHAEIVKRLTRQKSE